MLTLHDANNARYMVRLAEEFRSLAIDRFAGRDERAVKNLLSAIDLALEASHDLAYDCGLR